MTSDPKHLPPRDCLVLFGAETAYCFVHVVYVGNKVDRHEWRELRSGEDLAVDRVITWRELPEVE